MVVRLGQDQGIWFSNGGCFFMNPCLGPYEGKAVVRAFHAISSPFHFCRASLGDLSYGFLAQETARVQLQEFADSDSCLDAGFLEPPFNPVVIRIVYARRLGDGGLREAPFEPGLFKPGPVVNLCLFSTQGSLLLSRRFFVCKYAKTVIQYRRLFLGFGARFHASNGSRSPPFGFR